MLSIVVPVFNEDRTFPTTYRAVKKYVKTPFEVSVVYDFDGDTTVPVIKKLQKNDKRLRLVKNNLGRGPLNAIKMGLSTAKNGPVLVIMADLSDDLRDVDKMVALYKQGYTVVCGSRYMKGGRQIGGPLLKRTLSRLAGTSLHYLRGIPTYDVTNSFKLYDKKFLDSIKIESQKGFSIGMEITVKAFLNREKITEIPTTWTDRTAGEAKFKLFSWMPQYLKWYFYAFRPRKVSRQTA